MEKSLEELLIEAAEAKKAKEQAEQAQKGITSSDLADLFSQLETRLLTAMDEKISKAQEITRGEGVGRKGAVVDPREEDPLTYIMQKAKTPEDLSPEDKALIGGITHKAIFQGMRD